eukprot:3721221-Rhodomonas_salina.2
MGECCDVATTVPEWTWSVPFRTSAYECTLPARYPARYPLGVVGTREVPARTYAMSGTDLCRIMSHTRYQTQRSAVPRAPVPAYAVSDTGQADSVPGIAVSC